MHITATRIDEWARTREAQASLPRLVRRLIHTPGDATQAAFPAGDSTGLPGWDGELDCQQGSPWSPKGKSYWELSCDATVTAKANRDYKKRTRQTPKNIRTNASLVVVTARKWTQKAKWLKDKRRSKQWADIRAYDADDLEQWLEQSAPVALQFAEELGLSGPGVESTDKLWGDWSHQCLPSITSEAFFIDRQETRDRFITNVRGKLDGSQAEIVTVRADSVDEAAAFVCAAILTQPDLSAKSLAVTDPSGWTYVAQNMSLKVVVTARPEIAEKPIRRNGLVVVIPYATGDMAGYYRGAAGREGKADLVIDRPRISEFEKALMSIGLDEAESKRFAVSTGRSWSIFRRRRATNPAIHKPVWRDIPQAKALSTLCLLGGWSANKTVDREIVAEISGRRYEEIERDLRCLAKLDDAPVLQIGEVWKAKSPLELLDLFGDQITRDELDRFFRIAKLILSTPDPQLELPDEERHAAQIYGKIRSESSILIEALCDTLIKLAVRGPHVPALASASIAERIDILIRDLLHDADDTRWLSLSSFLPNLAEAAPEAFMRAVEASLIKPAAPVMRLFTETSNAIFGRCWHSGLLWALERLAWAPERLVRTSLILARLSKAKIKGNWANTPLSSLVGIYRSWYPHTAADINQRIAGIDTLIAKEPDIAFEVLNDLVHVGPDSAFPAARPIWRDDDAGAGYGVTHGEQVKMLIEAADRLIAGSKDRPNRIASLIEKLSTFDPARIKATLTFADDFTKPVVLDEDKEIVRTALRKHIHWHRNYDKVRGKALDKKLKGVEDLYERLVPEDLVVRHRWLFTNGWPDLPVHVRDGGYGKRDELVETWRTNALRDLYSDRGLSGIEQLTTACAPQSHNVGLALSKLNIKEAELAEWIAGKGGDFTFSEPLTMAISGLLRALEMPRSTELIKTVLEKAKDDGWDSKRVARFLTLASEQRSTWDIAASCGEEVENIYWSVTTPSPCLRKDGADFEFGIHRLLNANRPRSTLQVCHFDMKEVESKLLVEMLERFLKGEEPGGPLPDSWSIGEAIDALEVSRAIENDRLVRLEFGLIPVLAYEGEHHAKSLYNAILSDPKLFTELLCILYKPENAEREDTATESEQAAARIAWRVLRHCERLPGSQPDGTVEREKLIAFIDETRRLCGEANRLAACDKRLGEILAHSPTGADGIWPFEAARDVLDRPELEDMRRGFHTGTMNKRGVTSRSPDEGGSQERGLAEEYRKHSRALQHSHVNLAAAIEEIERSYERYGQREDLDAQLRQEGH